MQRENKFVRKIKKKEEFESQLLDLRRTARITAGGRRFHFRSVMVIGDRKGRVGVGVAKGLDVSQSIQKATRAAKKNLINVHTVDGTIPHQVEAKFKAAKIMLKPQKKGRGLVAGGTVRIVCLLAGIENISSKILGRTGNKLSNARATIKALKDLQEPRVSTKKQVLSTKKDDSKKEEGSK